MEHTDIKSWFPVLDQLEKDSERLLRQELTIQGKKCVFEKGEIVFFIGNMRCALTRKGWQFSQ